jgi:hypothetical protein
MEVAMTPRRADPRTTGGRAVGVPSLPVRRVRKRDGRLVPFEAGQITDAVARAAREVGRADQALAEEVTRRVVEDLARRFGGRSPGVEDIQDAVEATLIAMGLPEGPPPTSSTGAGVPRRGRPSRSWGCVTS